MDYLGNTELLNQPKTAFLASSTIPTDMVLRCYDWAQEMSKGKRCIIGGFSSHLEKKVLHFLLKGTCPIILVLARQMYKRIPEELQSLMENGRLLVISTSLTPRQSKTTAYNRNKYICEVADEVLFVCANENSSLYPLMQEYGKKTIKMPHGQVSDIC